jgi:hypothetical protein
MGALFVSNPRRRNARHTGRIGTRRLTNVSKAKLISKSAGISLAQARALKSADYEAYEDLFAAAGGKSALRKSKAGSKKVRKAIKAGTFKYSKWGTGSGKATRKTAAGGKRGMSPYNKFVKARFAAARKAGVETSMGQIADEWARKKAGKSPSPAKATRTRAKSRGRAKATRSKGGKKMSAYNRHVQQQVKAGKSFKQAAASWRKKKKNPGYGGIALRRVNQGGTTGLMPVDVVSGAVAQIPVIGGVAPIVAPMLVGGIAAIGLYYANEYAQDTTGGGEWGDYARSMSVPLVGGGLALALIKTRLGNFQGSGVLAAGLATVAGGIWFSNMFLGAGAEATEDLGAWAYTGGALNNNPYGAWAYTGGALNNPGGNIMAQAPGGDFESAGTAGAHGYGALALRLPSNGADEAEYGAAENGDALYVDDMSEEEVSSLVKGPHAWWTRFGRPAKLMRRQRGAVSHLAGRRGHRFGWLIKLLGFQGAAQVAANPNRRAIIHSLKAQALRSLPQHVAAASTTDANGYITHLPADITGAANGPGAVNGLSGFGGYGALALVGPNL